MSDIIFDDGFDLSEDSIPEGYQLEHALTVFASFEKAGRSSDYSVVFNPRMSLAQKEKVLAIFFLLHNGNDGDKQRVFSYLSSAFCVKVDTAIARLIQGFVLKLGTSAIVREAALNAYVSANENERDVAFSGLRKLRLSRDVLGSLVDAYGLSLPTSSAFVGSFFHGQQAERDSDPELFGGASREAENRFFLIDLIGIKQPDVDSDKIEPVLRSWYDEYSRDRDLYRGLRVLCALNAIGAVIEGEIVERFIPDSSKAWFESGETLTIVNLISTFRLVSYTPSLLSALNQADGEEKYRIASTLVMFGISAEDMAELIINAMVRDEAATQEAEILRSELENSPELNSEQSFALRALGEALDN